MHGFLYQGKHLYSRYNIITMISSMLEYAAGQRIDCESYVYRKKRALTGGGLNDLCLRFGFVMG